MNLRPLRPERNALAKLSYAPGDIRIAAGPAWCGGSRAVNPSGAAAWRGGQLAGTAVIEAVAGDHLDHVGVVAAETVEEALQAIALGGHALLGGMFALGDMADVAHALGAVAKADAGGGEDGDADDQVQDDRDGVHGVAARAVAAA